MLWARLIGAVLGTLTVGGVIWLGYVSFDANTGLIAGALDGRLSRRGGDEHFCVGGGTVLCVDGGATRRVGLCLAVDRPEGPQSVGRWWPAWRRAGAVLTRPSWLLFTPFVLGWLVLLSRDRWRHLVDRDCG